MMQKRIPAPNTFELGLVMAGAVSAGAYTAGVLDFLFEALGAWEEKKRVADPNVPDHTVQIRAVSGASAGGIASALCAMVPLTGHFPITDLATAKFVARPANAHRNLLYRAWVEDIDISGLLTLTDLKSATQGVRSLFNSDAVDAVANAAVQDVRAAVVKRQANPGQLPALPSFMANPLQLFLSLANLRGVPYLMTMQTEGGVRGHRMVAHMDYGHFAIFGVSGGPSEPLPGGSTSVNPQRGSQSASQDGWDDLMAAALSTSAFPVGLRSRKFQNDLSVYQLKLFSRTFGDDPDTPPLTIAPDLLEREARPYSFWTCDGGLLNNEPLEYARVALSGAPDEKNPRDAKDANRAVLMIDPFPDDTGAAVPEEKDLGDVMSLIFSLLPALKAQARFKPQELACALNESIYSRFLIAPVRQGKKPGETEIASFGLSGFAGFFEQSFRRHDFQLGRRNCQKFLRDHLAVHVENPVVRNWVARLKQAGSLDKFHTRTRDALGNDKLDENFVQLIPLMDSVLTPIDALEWPRLSGGVNALLAKLSPDLKLRIEAVLDRAVPSLMKLMGIKDKGIFGGLVKWLAEQKLRRVILDLAIDSISKDLKARGLG